MINDDDDDDNPSFQIGCNVHDSHVYKNTEMISERMSLILEQIVMFLSFQIVLSLVSAAVVCAILARTSGLDPSSLTTVPGYLKLLSVSGFSPLTLISVLMPLFVISLVFSALISMPNAVEAFSRRSIKLTGSCYSPAHVVALGCCDSVASIILFYSLHHESTFL